MRCAPATWRFVVAGRQAGRDSLPSRHRCGWSPVSHNAPPPHRRQGSPFMSTQQRCQDTTELLFVATCVASQLISIASQPRRPLPPRPPPRTRSTPSCLARTRSPARSSSCGPSVLRVLPALLLADVRLRPSKLCACTALEDWSGDWSPLLVASKQKARTGTTCVFCLSSLLTTRVCDSLLPYQHSLALGRTVVAVES